MLPHSAGPFDRPGTRFGQYEILGRLAEGGMGAVYAARQENPSREVALKVVRPDLVGPELISRFRGEAWALGRLQHPNIAQVYEAGTVETEHGELPYFAMELVRGTCLDAYAADSAATIRDRVEILRKVALAVHHAHQHGVIHRDLKPANILIDEHGEPRVLDFGVARIVADDWQATMQTDAGQLLGTVPYMSPEQASGDGLDVDARSDVYALGVLLFELLAGHLPYAVHGKHLPEALRMICEAEPTALGTTDSRLRGDLETIVRKALEKDRTRRFATAADFAEDLRRYLANEPITARPPSAIYRARRFARRHRSLVAGAVGILLALTAGLLLTAREAIRANAAEQLASDRERTERAARLQADQARAETEESLAVARAEADKAELVLKFLDEMLGSANPSVSLGRDLTVREAVDRAAVLVDAGTMRSRPLVAATARRILGRTYRALGDLDEAAQQLQPALALRQDHGARADEVVESLADLARVRLASGELEAAEVLLTQAREAADRLQPPDPGLQAGVIELLAVLRHDQSRTEESGELRRLALATIRADPEASPEDLAGALDSLAFHKQQIRRYDDAEALYREALDVIRSLPGIDAPFHQLLLTRLGVCLTSQRRFKEADDYLRRAHREAERLFDADHPRHADVLIRQANLWIAMRRLDEARIAADTALTIRRDRLGAHRDTALALEVLADIHRLQGDPDQAETLLQECLSMRKAVLGETSIAVAAALERLSAVSLARGDADAIERYAAEAVATWDRSASPDHYDSTRPMRTLARSRRDRGDHQRAATLLRRALAIRAQYAGPADGRQLEIRNDLIDTLLDAESWQEALELTEETHTACAEKFPATSPVLAMLTLQRGAALAGLHRFDEVAADLQPSWDRLAANERLWSSTRHRAAELLRRTHAAHGDDEQAAHWAAERDRHPDVDR